MNDELGRNQRRDMVKNEISRYILKHKEEETYIETRWQIYDDLERAGKTHGISRPTFYKYLKQMKCINIAEGKFDFASDTNIPLDSLITYRKYNKYILFTLDDATTGAYIADAINSYYVHYSSSIHCVHLQDVIICFYYDKDFERTELKKEIKTLLRDYTIKIVVPK